VLAALPSREQARGIVCMTDTLTWHRLDDHRGGWRAYHGLRWRCTVRGKGRAWAWTVEFADVDGAWCAVSHDQRTRKGLA